VLLGRLHGISTPVNLALTRLALRAARERAEPGSLAKAEVEEAISNANG
jgi:hypothetical protein